VEVFQPYSTLMPLSNLFGIIFEPFKGFDISLVDDNTIAYNTNTALSSYLPFNYVTSDMRML
jgi:hypothetical protein